MLLDVGDLDTLLEPPDSWGFALLSNSEVVAYLTFSTRDEAQQARDDMRRAIASAASIHVPRPV